MAMSTCCERAADWSADRDGERGVTRSRLGSALVWVLLLGQS